MVLARVTGIFTFNPIFARRGVPNVVKVGASMALAVVMTTAGNFEYKLPNGFFPFAFDLGKELLVGAVLGQVIPWDLEGIDFCMTALFVIIVVDQWEHTKNHLPALLGGALAVVCLIVFGQSSFMLPALLITSGILLCVRTKEGET